MDQQLGFVFDYQLLNILIILFFLIIIQQLEIVSEQIMEDLQFEKKLAKATYKTTYQDFGGKSTRISAETGNGINGKFTDHLLHSGMVRNGSLNTASERERWMNGSKDWMEKLG